MLFTKIDSSIYFLWYSKIMTNVIRTRPHTIYIYTKLWKKQHAHAKFMTRKTLQWYQRVTLSYHLAPYYLRRFANNKISLRKGAFSRCFFLHFIDFFTLSTWILFMMILLHFVQFSILFFNFFSILYIFSSGFSRQLFASTFIIGLFRYKDHI